MTMIRPRIIPVLLLNGKGLVKTVQFKKPGYVGDPINAVQIFNKKEVDELLVVDFLATVENRSPNLEFIKLFASEAFMPFCYGGGIRNPEEIQHIIECGAEKVAINASIVENPALISAAVKEFGSQSIVASIDVKKSFFGSYKVFIRRGKVSVPGDVVTYAKKVEDMGVGEILLTSIDREGTMNGYDIELIQKVSDQVQIPVIALGGAGGYEDFNKAISQGHASAVAAASIFVYQGRHRAVLISYPMGEEFDSLFSSHLSS